jgi:hypothetical protein
MFFEYLRMNKFIFQYQEYVTRHHPLFPKGLFTKSDNTAHEK